MNTLLLLALLSIVTIVAYQYRNSQLLRTLRPIRVRATRTQRRSR